MLEFEKLTGNKLEDIYHKNLDEEVIFWKNLKNQRVLQYGYYNNQPNFGRVHDPNASNLDTFTSHAGLFSSIDGLARSIMNFNKNHDLLKRFTKKSAHRFHYGFDTVGNPDKTLAGSGCSPQTFGHLGFTGTSFWIDPAREVGHIILSNATKYYWYEKDELNTLREAFGSFVWKNHS
jgi:CubicO group peptidase (beta-lactamase class C family)